MKKSETILCHWSTVSYDRGIHISSHRNEVDHRVVIRQWPDRPQADIVHERKGPEDNEWEAVDLEEVC